jgi:hypothetical protein
MDYSSRVLVSYWYWFEEASWFSYQYGNKRTTKHLQYRFKTTTVTEAMNEFPAIKCF